MSRKHLELAVSAVIAVEFVAAVCLIFWAVFFRAQPVSAPAPKTTVTHAQAIPVVAPVTYAQGLTRPTTIAAPADTADKRLFVTEAQGTIRIIAANGTLAAQPLLDIKSKVLDDQGERGMLGLALHPDFKKNGFFYVNYIDKDSNTIISRWHVPAQTGVADPNSEKVLIKVKQPYPNHNGGMLLFGPDGYLYAALGDGGSGGDPQNRAQNKNELFGKILRIDVNHGDPYAIPASNPFKGVASAKGEVWDFGLRNPWRFSFDRTTGDMLIGDVGQDKYEEIDFQKAGKGGINFGWRCQEGLHDYNTDGCQPANKYTAPVIEYDHSDKRCSVTGGYIYRGTKYPAMAGKYFYADLCSGQLYYAVQSASKWQPTLAASTQLQISSFGQDSSGELYAADVKTGIIYRLTDSAVH
jgi:glucose/arabinose dehydrogenase